MTKKKVDGGKKWMQKLREGNFFNFVLLLNFLTLAPLKIFWPPRQSRSRYGAAWIYGYTMSVIYAYLESVGAY